MSAGVVVKAILLVVALQFSIQDGEGQLFGTALDTCISSMVKEQSLERLIGKLSKDWKLSSPESVMYWIAKQIFPQKGECGEFSEERFTNVIKEVYGRSLVINFLTKGFIIGWKAAFLHEAVLILLVLDVVEFFLEYFDYTIIGKVVGTVGILAVIVYTWCKTTVSWTAVTAGLGVTVASWIYYETCLESIAKLASNDESYHKSELTDIVTSK